jgi:hypothetical protein
MESVLVVLRRANGTTAELTARVVADDGANAFYYASLKAAVLQLIENNSLAVGDTITIKRAG